MAAPPGMAGSPAVLPGRERRARLQRIVVAEVRGKSPACGSLRSGSSGGSFSRRLRSQPLQARLIALLHALLALEQAVLCLQQPLLRALRPAAFRLLRLQLLHPLLQTIDAVLPLSALARQHVTLPLLHHLLSLLDALLTLLRTRFDLFLSRQSRAHSGRCARWCGDARLGMSRHGRSLRRRGMMDLGSWPCSARYGRSRRCGDTWRHMRGHGWTLWWGSRPERRCGGSRHGRGRRWTRHRGWSCWTGHGRWCRWTGCWRSCAAWTSSLLGERAGAHRNRGDTKKKCCNTNAAQKHDLNSLMLRRPELSTRKRRNRSLGVYDSHCDFAMRDWCNSSQP